MAAILDLRVHDSNESPTNAPHSCGQEPQNARIPHLLGTERAANKVINPHQSPTYPGVGGGGSGFTLTGALARIILKVSMAQVIQLALKTRSRNQNETAISCNTTTKVMLPNRKTERKTILTMHLEWVLFSKTTNALRSY